MTVLDFGLSDPFRSRTASSRPPSSGRWVRCDCGDRHYGPDGAAGALIVNGTARTVLLQHRSAGVHHGDTWGIPGGARKPGEGPLEAAWREVETEVGISPDDLGYVSDLADNHGNWSYTTIIAVLRRPVRAQVLTTEATEVRWVPVEQVHQLKLHPGLAESWPHLEPIVREFLGSLDQYRFKHRQVSGQKSTAIPGYRYYLVTPETDDPAASPLGSPYKNQYLPVGRSMTATCLHGRAHRAPDLECGCGFTSAHTLTGLAAYLWAEHQAQNEKAAHLGLTSTRLDDIVVARVDVPGRRVTAHEGDDFYRHEQLNLKKVYLPAHFAVRRRRIRRYYGGIAVRVGHNDGERWLEELAPGFPRNTTRCGYCWTAPPETVHNNVCDRCRETPLSSSPEELISGGYFKPVGEDA